MNKWTDGTEGLAEFLVQDSGRRAYVTLEDGQECHAAWDLDYLRVLVHVDEGYVPYSEFCRQIERWRPKREPLVLTGETWSGDGCIYIHTPTPCPIGTHFTYTLTEVV